jgi:subtilisin family serine protease
LIERIIRKAAAQQALIIAPAGNKGPSAPPAYPGAYEDVIAVTATDSDDRVYVEANQGGYVALAAPGVDILVLQTEGDTALISGTSYAAAHAAGVASLMLGYDPQLTADGVRTALEQSAVDLGRPGKDQMFGAGLVSAAGAMRALRQTPPVKAVARPVATRAPADREPVSVGSIDRQ